MSNEYVHFINNSQPAINEDNLNLMQQLIKQDINGAVSGDTLPIGAILPYPGTTAPTNWLVCNGAAVSRATYSDLYNVIGTTYGAGDGSTTFNLPDLRGKHLMGYDSTQTEFNALGKTGGEKKHTQTVSEMPSHYHAQSLVGGSSGNPGNKAAFSWSQPTNQYDYSGTDLAQRTGGGQAFNVLDPYLTTNYIIKAFQTAGVVAQVSNSYDTSSTNVYSCNYINSSTDVSSLITKSSKVGTVYVKQAYKKGNRVYFSAQFEILQEGSGLFTIDSSLIPKYFEVGTGINYQAGSSEPMIVKISANTLSIDSNVYASALKSYAIIHIEWEV